MKAVIKNVFLILILSLTVFSTSSQLKYDVMIKFGDDNLIKIFTDSDKIGYTYGDDVNIEITVVLYNYSSTFTNISDFRLDFNITDRNHKTYLFEEKFINSPSIEDPTISTEYIFTLVLDKAVIFWLRANFSYFENDSLMNHLSVWEKPLYYTMEYALDTPRSILTFNYLGIILFQFIFLYAIKIIHKKNRGCTYQI